RSACSCMRGWGRRLGMGRAPRTHFSPERDRTVLRLPSDSSAEPVASRHPRAHDWLLAVIPFALLCALMTFRDDVQHPRGEDPARPLGHYASLLHSGHVPGGVFIGIACLVLAIVGILGLLGDSPLDLRGDETISTT